MQGNYTVIQMPGTAFKLPALTPAGDYRIDVRIYNHKNQTLIFPRLYFTVKAKGSYILRIG